jgi:regulator of sigma E protease
VRVEKFYLFFDAGFSLFKYKPKKSETEYGIGWLPLGGYCKIAGMIDESMDVNQLNAEPQPWEFRTKPAWQRLLIMLGGVLFNVILAFFIYVGMLTCWGEEYLANKDAVHGVSCDTVALKMGFRDGDKVLAINGKPIDAFSDIQRRMTLYREMDITLQRGNETVTISPDYYENVSAMAKTRFLQPLIPFIIANVPDSSHNKTSGLAPGDKVTGAAGIKTCNINEIKRILSENKNSSIRLTVNRNNTEDTVTVKVNSEGMIGVELETDFTKFFPIIQRQYNFFESFPAAVVKAKTRLYDQLCELRLMATPKTKTYKQVGSFISIGNIYSAQWDWHRFWDITALLSIMLAVLNLLPIPALDGGHVIFLLFEVITRRKPSDKFLTYAQVAGMIILIFIMIYAIGNDIVRHILN